MVGDGVDMVGDGGRRGQAATCRMEVEMATDDCQRSMIAEERITCTPEGRITCTPGVGSPVHQGGGGADHLEQQEP